MAPTLVDPKTANIWTARIIPLVLTGLAGYVTWVFIVLVCVDYLLKTNGTNRPPRPHAAVALIVVYAILLLIVAFSYFRLLYTVASNPGFVPRGPKWRSGKGSRKKAGQGQKEHERRANKRTEKSHHDVEHSGGHKGGPAFPNGSPIHEDKHGQDTSPTLKDFYNRKVFTCEGDGRPIWCSTCLNFKPDRAHHCREVGRCVRKMDHFCPWVGGIISETSFKFFLQFTIWASILCVFDLVTMAILIAESKKETNQLNVNWILTLAFGGFFLIFTLGMTLSSLQFVFVNTTTIENLSRRNKVWTLAVLIPNIAQLPPPPPFNTVTYPLDYIPPDQDETHPQTAPSTPTRTFAILHTKPGENPWDLGYFNNFKSVMGDHWYDWLLPFRYSPCCNHERYEAQFETGPVVQRMKEDAGLAPPSFQYKSEKPERRRRRKRRRRHDGIDEKAPPRARETRDQRAEPGERTNDFGARTMESTVA